MVTRTPGTRPEERTSRRRGDTGRARGGDTWRALRAAWTRLERGLPELKDDVLCCAKAHADLARLAARRTARKFVRGIATGIVALAIVVVALTLVIDGIAGGLTVAFDGRTWLANLVTGTGIVAVVATVAAIHDRRRTAARLQRLAERYARHDARQREMEVRGTP